MNAFVVTAGLSAALLFTGCQSLPPGAEPGPHRTMAYEILIEASEPGAKIEANGEVIGNTPIRLKMFGDPDGTFHDFGSPYYVIRALPVVTNQFVQQRVFWTGHMMSREDRIPSRINFDMDQNTPVQPIAPGYPPVYHGPPVIFYPEPYYYGPSFRFRFGPGYHRRW